ncbi:hypothetical protein [Rhodopila sp.]|jgi:hypothetical protein|uniref:hypothetical protein n=1 Tax=Rhodopila sp. TaxID=2480087 RepID=UPI002B9C9B04|nr:hypothetical protein [Rhodopila sp.]HVZ08368.1 hypothetical protein [Rhodopila sp.]
MSRPPSKDKPQRTSASQPAKADRMAREAAALRANLLKRKDQARKRAAAPTKPEGER